MKQKTEIEEKYETEWLVAHGRVEQVRITERQEWRDAFISVFAKED